jgi:hypothetical protein
MTTDTTALILLVSASDCYVLNLRRYLEMKREWYVEELKCMEGG